MASGKRLPGEEFEDYRKRLRLEGKITKLKLKGDLVHCSSKMTTTDGFKWNKVKVGGTYHKPIEEEKGS
jgi:hypothetical protein